MKNYKKKIKEAEKIAKEGDWSTPAPGFALMRFWLPETRKEVSVRKALPIIPYPQSSPGLIKARENRRKARETRRIDRELKKTQRIETQLEKISEIERKHIYKGKHHIFGL